MRRTAPAFERGDRFLLLFALANAGGVIAYVPLLTLLLPARIVGLAEGAHVEWLSAVTLGGAIAASLSNILFGWASDRIGTRRGWAAAGLVLTIASYAFVHAAQSLVAIVAAVVAYQTVLNMLLAPLAAWAADTVPDRRKGLLGGLLGAAPMIGAMSGVIATLPMFTTDLTRLAVTCALAVALTLPLLLINPPGYPDAPDDEGGAIRKVGRRSDFALLWTARLLVQVAGSVLFGFLFYYFQSLPEAATEAGVARLSTAAWALAFPIALLFGSSSDRLGRRKPFLVAAAAGSGAGLAMMASAHDLSLSATGYILFGCASAVFLVLHSSFAMQLLPSAAHRGRDLGVLNLTNTLPSIVAPVLAVWLIPGRGFAPLLGILAGLMLLAAVLILFVRNDAQAT